MTPKPEFRKTFVLSTAHISKETNDCLTADPDWMVVYNVDCGYIIPIPDYVSSKQETEECEPLKTSFPELFKILKWASENSCWGVHFDCDAFIYDNLPVFDW